MMEALRHGVGDLLNSNSTTLAQPVMHAFTSLVLLGSVAFQTILGRPDAARMRRDRHILKRSVDDFIAKEEPIAIEQLLCNIGADGCHAKGASPGVVIASPSTADPDYFYTWTRDSGLVFKAIVERFAHSYDEGLQENIQNYVVSQAKLQTVSNPSGDLSDGRGLGEAKYHADLTAFTGGWGRPQRDGPALRAIALIGYSKWLVANGYESTASEVVWPVIRNDLAYVAQYWNQTGFDLWEEVQGSSFFTVASQHRSLVEGSLLAKSLGISSADYDAIAPHVLCFLQTFYSVQDGYIKSNINVNYNRLGKDANAILGSIHNFDPALGCDAATFQPCSDRALASHRVLIDAFRSLYGINSGIGRGQAVAVGRYPEDVYFDGNPWYLNTLAAAEQLYDALYVWQQTGVIEVTWTSTPFFGDLYSGAGPGTYKQGTEEYEGIYNAVFAYADGFFDVVARYAQENGSMAEQFDRDNGTPLSARDLTWSYAAFLTAAARREGVVPAGWADPDATSVPAVCAATSRPGSYSPATKTSFPADQTPKNPSGPTSTGSFTKPTAAPTKTTTGGSGPCATATAVAVTFSARKETQWGQTVKVVGNVAQLGNWDVAKAPALSASDYTAQNPVWRGTVTLPAGRAVDYKYVVVEDGKSTSWESDPNRSWTVPRTCSTTASRTDTWR